MTHADIQAAAQRYTHGWVPIDQSKTSKQAPAKTAAPPKPPPMSAADRAAAAAKRKADAAAARDAKKADTAAKRQAARVAAIRSKLKGAQSRAQARAAVSGQKLEDLQVIAASLKLSTKGDQPTLVARLVNHFMPSLLAAAAIRAAAMSTADINNLPDSDFAYIEPGGSKDAEGKTVPRSLRHFPINDAAHVRNALSRAPQSPFGDKAMPKIRAACKKFGIRWSGMGDYAASAIAASVASMNGVELARPGNWQLSTGKRTFTAENLKDAADFFEASGQTRIPIGFGHQDPRFDGDPAFGWVSNIRYAEDGRGPVLLGDLVDMDEWLAAAAPHRWPNRSIEGFANLDWNGRTYSLAVNRLALLGSTPPAMPILRDLADIRQAIAAAAAESEAELISASALDESEELSEQDTEDPAVEAVVTPREMETGMDPAKFREALGLDDDVSDDEVMEALAVAGFVAPESPADGAPAPVTASAFKAPPGTMLIEASAWNDREDRIKRLEAAEKRHRDGERDQIITQAIQDGKFAPARREHWTRAWDLDPEGTRQAIASFPRNMLPIAATGYSAGDSDEEWDAEFAHLFPPTARKGA